MELPTELIVMDQVRFDLFKVALQVAINMPSQVGNREVVACALDLTNKAVETLVQQKVVK